MSSSPDAIVFVLRAGERFAEVPLAGAASVAGLAKRASDAFGWGWPATRIDLFPVLDGRAHEDAVEAGAEAGHVGPRLRATDSLAAAGVVPLARLLARLATPAASPAQGGGGGSDATAAAAAVVGAGGALDLDILTRLASLQASLGDVRREVADLRRAHDEADAVSFVSPTGKQYEAFVDTQVDNWLRDCCGLSTALFSRRGLASTDPAAHGQQWDARFSVTCDASWAAAGARSSSFLVYGGSPYRRPDKLPAPRHLSPTKAAAAEYFAVLEYTRLPGWHEGWTSATGKIRKALLPRLEARLAICVQRAGAAGIDVKSVLDVVAVVGVVSEDACQEGVEAQLSRPTCPHAHLRAMFLARRFVFFLCVAAIPAGAPVLAAASPGST